MKAGPWPGVRPAPAAAEPGKRWFEATELPVQRIGAIALFLLLFCSFSRVTDYAGPYLHIPLILSLFSLLMAVLSGQVLAAFKTRTGIALTAFTVWLIAAIPFSVWKGDSFNLVFDDWLKAFSLFAVTVALLASVRQVRSALRTLGYSFLVTAILALLFGRTQDGRFGLSVGLYGGSNELATAMVQGCIFWWYMVKSPSRNALMRFLAILPIGPLVVILLNTASRAGVIVLCVLILMIFFQSSMRQRIVLGLVVILGVAGAVAVAPGAAAKRLATIFGAEAEGSPVEAVNSSKQRAYLLKRSIELTVTHPIFGVGPGQFAVAENGLAAQEGVRAQWLGTHNTYTQISSESGLPALLMFVASLWYCWKELSAAVRIHKKSNSRAARECLTMAFTLRLALVSYIVFFCFEHVGYEAFYPCLAGIIVAFGRASRKLAAEQTAPASRQNAPARAFGPAWAARNISPKHV